MGITAHSARWQEKVRAWALRRQGPDVLPLRLAARRVYILPTAAGWTFAALIAVMFVAGVNYGNGLALLFTFWLTGFALVGMVQTQRSLVGLTVRAASARPGFAGSHITLVLDVDGRTALGDLRLDTSSGEAAGTAASDSILCTGELPVAIPARRRGRWRAPPLRLSCTAPFGLFRTWTWLQLDAVTVVYPRPAGDLPVPETPGDGGGTAQAIHGQDELGWLRDFREGDSPRQVAWKAYARGAPLLVREYHGTAAPVREFDYARLTGLDVEARLSQLSRWIVDGAARGEAWVLRLPDGPPLSGGGEEHRAACLRRLGLFGLRGENP